MAQDEKLKEAFTTLKSEFRDLYPDYVEELDSPPEPLLFYRNFVSQNRPVIIKHAIDHWPALTRWNIDYFRGKIGSIAVTVAVTPNGYADAIHGDHFIMPQERKMTVNNFLDIISQKPEERDVNGVFYIQKQNSNLTDEFQTLMDDVDKELPWGTKAFGSTPDAVNFWMGDKNAITSLHKDHYENLYCVISGQKTFTLYPPTDLPFMPYETHSAAYYKMRENTGFEIIDDPDGMQVPWIAANPLNPDHTRHPQFANARPITVTVKAGDTLYLPSLWFHHVQQSQACIAVNYWYDMDFDIKWVYYKFLEKLSTQPS